MKVGLEFTRTLRQAHRLALMHMNKHALTFTYMHMYSEMHM